MTDVSSIQDSKVSAKNSQEVSNLDALVKTTGQDTGSVNSLLKDTSSVEMAQFLEALNDSLDIENSSFLQTDELVLEKSFLDPSNPLSAFEKGFPVIREQLAKAGEQMLANPSPFIKSLLDEKGEFSCSKALLHYSKELREVAHEILAGPSVGCGSSAMVVTDDNNDDDSTDDEYSLEGHDSFAATAQNLVRVSDRLGDAALLLATSSDEAAERDSTIGDQLIQDASDALQDVIHQINEKHKAERRKKKLGPFAKAFKIIVTVMPIIIAAATGNPAMAIGVGGVELCGLTGATNALSKGMGDLILKGQDAIVKTQDGLSKATGTDCTVLHKNEMLNKDEARLLGDILVIVAVTAVVAVATENPGMALMAASALGSALPLWSDLGKVIVKLNGGHDRELIMMLTQTIGQFICLVGMMAGGMAMGASGGIPELTLALLVVDGVSMGVYGGLEVQMGMYDKDIADANAELTKAAAAMRLYDTVSDSMLNVTNDVMKAFADETDQVQTSYQQYSNSTASALNSLTEILA